MSAPAVSPAGATVPAAAHPVASLLSVYPRVGPLFVRGEGAELIAGDGTRYLDFTAGIAVNALGYGHPIIRDAIERALETGLVHVSNLYHTAPGHELAAELVSRAFPGAVFFCNSGAEANEAAFKFARKWSGKPGIVAFSGGFHGRLFASLAATDRPDYRRPFEPLLGDVSIIPLGDRAAAGRAIRADHTGVVIIEPIQGEGGVRPVPADFLGVLRELCDARGAALVFDEVQCGLGRTGTLFAFEQAGVAPDAVTLAKPLAGGLPMGAVIVAPHIAAALAPGDHATTFGGGPLVATVALAVLRAIAQPAFLGAVREAGARLGDALRRIAVESRRVREVRGRGLMWGIALAAGEAATPVVTAARERRLLVLSAGPDVIRLVPPLTVSSVELDRGIAVLREVLA